MASIKYSSQRLLKPRVFKRSPSPIIIQKLSFLYIKGITQILIHPSKILVNSKELLNMIEEKKDIIMLGNGLCVFRKDIFLATEAALEKVEDDSSKIKDLYLPSNRRVPKRPTNAFILYRNALRKRVKRVFPEFNNNQVSKFLGAMWNNASRDIKEKYEVQATECRRVHKEVYPDFEYNPKRDLLESSESLYRDPQSNSHSSLLNYNLTFDDPFQSGATDDLILMPDINKTLEDVSLSNLIEYNGDTPLLESNLICNEYCCSTEEMPDSSEWNLICNMVTDLFPENLDQSQLIDEKLWSSMKNIEQYQSTNGFSDSINEHYFGIFDNVDHIDDSANRERNNLGF